MKKLFNSRVKTFQDYDYDYDLAQQDLGEGRKVIICHIFETFFRFRDLGLDWDWNFGGYRSFGFRSNFVSLLEGKLRKKLYFAFD